MVGWTSKHRTLATKANRESQTRHDETMRPHIERCRAARMSYKAMAKHFTELRPPTCVARRGRRGSGQPPW